MSAVGEGAYYTKHLASAPPPSPKPARASGPESFPPTRRAGGSAAQRRRSAHVNGDPRRPRWRRERQELPQCALMQTEPATQQFSWSHRPPGQRDRRVAYRARQRPLSELRRPRRPTLLTQPTRTTDRLGRNPPRTGEAAIKTHQTILRPAIARAAALHGKHSRGRCTMFVRPRARCGAGESRGRRMLLAD